MHDSRSLRKFMETVERVRPLQKYPWLAAVDKPASPDDTKDMQTELLEERLATSPETPLPTPESLAAKEVARLEKLAELSCVVFREQFAQSGLKTECATVHYYADVPALQEAAERMTDELHTSGWSERIEVRVKGLGSDYSPRHWKLYVDVPSWWEFWR